MKYICLQCKSRLACPCDVLTSTLRTAFNSVGAWQIGTMMHSFNWKILLRANIRKTELYGTPIDRNTGIITASWPLFKCGLWTLQVKTIDGWVIHACDVCDFSKDHRAQRGISPIHLRSQPRFLPLSRLGVVQTSASGVKMRSSSRSTVATFSRLHRT